MKKKALKVVIPARILKQVSAMPKAAQLAFIKVTNKIAQTDQSKKKPMVRIPAEKWEKCKHGELLVMLDEPSQEVSFLCPKGVCYGLGWLTLKELQEGRKKSGAKGWKMKFGDGKDGKRLSKD